MMLIMLGTLAAGLILFAALIYFGQDRMVFAPSAEIEASPAEIGLTAEEVNIRVATGQNLHAWFFPPLAEQSAAIPPTVLFFHGNAGNMSHRLETARFLLGLGVQLVMFDYRGYGQSDGTPSEQTVYEDATAVYDWLVETKAVRPDNLYLFGRSLGGAVAVELASRVDCAGLIVESSFTSIADMGRRIYPFLPTDLMVRHRFDSIKRIGKLTCPILITHSPDDELIPFEMGQMLFERATDPKTFVALSGGHNEREYFGNDLYINGLRRFFGGQKGRS